jgi:hypothetical protein
MIFYKIQIDENKQKQAFFSYRDMTNGKDSVEITRAIPLDLIGEQEPKILELVSGDIVSVYYEERNQKVVSEAKTIYEDSTTLDESTIEYLKALAHRACLEEEFDELLAPPSVDQQVEDFIKEFFEDGEISNIDNDKPLEQKDFLAEFFAELEEDSDN